MMVMAMMQIYPNSQTASRYKADQPCSRCRSRSLQPSTLRPHDRDRYNQAPCRSRSLRPADADPDRYSGEILYFSLSFSSLLPVSLLVSTAWHLALPPESLSLSLSIPLSPSLSPPLSLLGKLLFPTCSLKNLSVSAMATEHMLGAEDLATCLETQPNKHISKARENIALPPRLEFLHQTKK